MQPDIYVEVATHEVFPGNALENNFNPTPNGYKVKHWYITVMQHE